MPILSEVIRERADEMYRENERQRKVMAAMVETCEQIDVAVKECEGN